MSDCAVWLKKILSCGASEYKVVLESAEEAGFSKAEVRKARKELGVKTWHQVDGEGTDRLENWFWFLPEDQEETSCGKQRSRKD